MTGNKGNTEATGKKYIKPAPISLDLSSFESTTKSLGKMIEDYASGAIDFKESQFSRLVWAVTSYINCLRISKDDEYEKRLEQIETQLESLGIRQIPEKTGKKAM